MLLCLLHVDALVAVVGSFNCTGRLENEQELLIPTIATDNHYFCLPLVSRKATPLGGGSQPRTRSCFLVSYGFLRFGKFRRI
jgi:hypothetical protein